MKRINSLLLCFLIGVCLQATLQAQSLRKSTHWSVKDTVYNLGYLQGDSQPYDVQFYVYNSSNVRISLRGVEAECSCTSVSWERDTVSKGDSLKITLKLDPKEIYGSFSRTVSVFSSSDTLDVRLEGFVVHLDNEKTESDFKIIVGDIKFEKNTFAMHTVFDRYPKKKVFQVYNASKEPLDSINYSGLPSYISLDLPEVITPNTMGDLVVKYDTNRTLSYGYLLHEFIIYQSGDSLKAKITANVSPYSDYKTESQHKPVIEFLDGSSLDLGSLKADTSYAFTVSVHNTGNEKLEILEVKPSCKCVTLGNITKLSIRPNRATEVMLYLDTSNRVGKTKKAIYFYSNDPVTPAKEFIVTANVENEEN